MDKSDQYIMTNANRCTVHPQHIMINRGREEKFFADIYRCNCGEWRIGNTDETKSRRQEINNG